MKTNNLKSQQKAMLFEKKMKNDKNKLIVFYR
jgi:hypothetical protein